MNVWISNVVKMGLCSFLLSFSLQAFIETMFASKAPVEEGFLYAKVSFNAWRSFVGGKCTFLICIWHPIGFHGHDQGIHEEDLVLKCHW